MDRLEKSLVPVLMCFYASRGDIKKIKRMLKLDADVNAVDQDGRSACHLACAEGQIETVKYLISIKANFS